VVKMMRGQATRRKRRSNVTSGSRTLQLSSSDRQSGVKSKLKMVCISYTNYFIMVLLGWSCRVLLGKPTFYY